MIREIAASLSIILGAMTSAEGAEPTDLVSVEGSTTKVCQLSGDLDRPEGKPTLSQTGERFGVIATDLGSSFEHKGRLYFLFGDTWGRPGGKDVLAWTTSNDPEAILLDFHRAPDGKWLPLAVPGVRLGPFEVPSYGVSIGGDIYVVLTTDHSPEKTMGRSVVARSRDDGRTFDKLYDLSDDKFINVALWTSGQWLYVFGSGDYRRSSVCLARVKPADFRRPSKLSYLSGMDAGGSPQWSPRQRDATPLFEHDVVGEFSVAFCEPVGRYVMLYNSTKPRGITMRSAATPWGPWSDGQVIFNPWRDEGYGHFIHLPFRLHGGGKTFHDPQREAEGGGEYGPYIISRFTTGTAEQCRLYYTMSTWNPYQVVLMRSDLRRNRPGTGRRSSGIPKSGSRR